MAFAYIVPRQQSVSSGSVSSTGTSTSTTGTTSLTTTSAAASSTTTPATNTAPFFPDPSTRIDPNDGKPDLSKTVLEWVFVVLIILIFFGFIIYRFFLLRASNRPLRDFFRLRRRWSSYLASHPHYPSSSYPYSGSSYPSIQNLNTNTRSYDISNIPLPLANVPSSHQLSQLSQLGRSGDVNPNARRTRAVNVDEGGRRLDSRPNPEDGSAEGWDQEKDALPAYDKYGGPPGYLEAGVGEGGAGVWRVGPLGLLHARPSSRGDGEREPSPVVTTAIGGADTHANAEADANLTSTPTVASPLTVPARVYEPTSATAPASVHASPESRS